MGDLVTILAHTDPYTFALIAVVAWWLDRRLRRLENMVAGLAVSVQLLLQDHRVVNRAFTATP